MNSGIGGMSSFFHLGRELVGDHRGDTGEAARPGRQVQPGVPDGGDLDVIVLGLVDRIQAEEGEEQVRVDALHAGAVGHDQAGVDAFQGALGDDDRDLFDRLGLRRFGLWVFE